MKLLQETILCLLLTSLCRGQNDTVLEVKNTTAPVSSTSANTSISTGNETSSPDATGSIEVGTSSEGTTNKESLTSSSAVNLLAVKGEELGTITKDFKKTESFTTSAPLTSRSLSDTSITLQSSPSQTEIQSSTKTKETPVTTPPPESSPSKTSTLSSISAITTSENISQFKAVGVENERNTTSSTSPSYSSIILPVVIALIVITLSVFVLVGLYRMCWKTDPGTPENGNDQPQSDKESVKLLTVKTISHESGEHSAQGKTKN
uniref:Endomucin n=1 Tax=Catagonus wagneri TaxID=51154 RepID=A0A8C3YGG3_9CETA